MARATNVYLVWRTSDNKLVGAFTVKYESQTWAARQPGGMARHRRTRMNDGIGAKTEQPCPWEPPGFNMEGATTGRIGS